MASKQTDTAHNLEVNHLVKLLFDQLAARAAQDLEVKR
jgi:hypothetical protein